MRGVSSVDEKGWWRRCPSQGSPGEGGADLPAGRIPMCCWPSNTKLPMGWPSGLYAAPWLTEGSRRKPDCSHSRTQRRKKKRYTKQSAIVPAAALKRYSNNMFGALWRGCGSAFASVTELRCVNSFTKCPGGMTSPTSLTGGTSSAAFAASLSIRGRRPGKLGGPNTYISQCWFCHPVISGDLIKNFHFIHKNLIFEHNFTRLNRLSWTFAFLSITKEMLAW